MFQSMVARNKPVIVFAPHPDDETLGCGGTIARKITEGFDLYIVFVTDGRNSHKRTLGINNNPSPEELISIRKREAVDAARILGLSERKIIFLSFEDGKLDRNLSRAKKEIRNILKRIQPEEIFVPYAHENHKDHRITNFLVSACIRELGIKCTIYEYLIQSNRKTAFSDFFSCDISDTLRTKEEAIRAYKSQVELFFPSQKRPVLLPEFLQSCQKPEELFIVK